MLISNVPVAKALPGAQKPDRANPTALARRDQPAHSVVDRPKEAEFLRAVELSKLIDINSPDQLAFHQALKQLSAPFVDLICSVIESLANWQKFVSCPSSVRGHHSEVGGNLRHTIEVANLCQEMASTFRDMVDFDVLITAALLHDFGKIHCYKAGVLSQWHHSDENRLLGHKVLGASPVWFHLQRSSGFTQAQVLGLMNCLVASNMQNGDSRGPASMEAEILMRADQLSAVGDLHRSSVTATKGRAGFGVNHPHLRQVPFHIKGSQPAPVERPSRFGTLVIRASGVR